MYHRLRRRLGEELGIAAWAAPAGAASPAAVVISAVSGTAGVGKTALAVHWAHRVAGQFPDGQLYVNLRGFDPGGAALDPQQALRGFLDAFEVPATRIPEDLGAQVGLYRSLLAGGGARNGAVRAPSGTASAISITIAVTSGKPSRATNGPLTLSGAATVSTWPTH